MHLTSSVGAKVVRVNDLQLSEVDGQLRLVGADVGLRGLLRRVGTESLAERIAGLPAGGVQDVDFDAHDFY